MPAILPGTPLDSFVNAICQAASEGLTQALSTSWNCTMSAEKAPESGDAAATYIVFSVAGGIAGNATLQMSTADVLLLGQKALNEAVEATAQLEQRHREALEGVAKKIAATSVSALKESFGEVQVQASLAESSAGAGTSVRLVLEEAAVGKRTVELQLSDELVASMSAVKLGRADDSVKNASEDIPGNLDRILGVKLNLSLRFGRRSLTLREVLDLNSGSVVELDRQVQEPADLMLGDKLVARGEVVIVDGNYGIRVTEVVDV